MNKYKSIVDIGLVDNTYQIKLEPKLNKSLIINARMELVNDNLFVRKLIKIGSVKKMADLFEKELVEQIDAITGE